MFDKNNNRIRRGDFVRYDERIYRVSYIYFRTIILDDGEKKIALKVPRLTYPILNLEVVNHKTIIPN
ncbi:hypothetical protein Calab_1504 [Caldithrix abyssi DSM 13497]|uniref:Uncharacterized protein n=1 Tax=Caldithrix abyssi DSM 13497 TaxID=880073 RepID=H1XQH8_CALAY|nr:hypothetical protein [Caldithrix abyssi]APF16968.1 hypothetical protein Cabys_217 [Caldithrix abyssi DSM 13497]APF20343.1 hypothetical protein Cabys_3597 [Caldithrix abyssi DSM 13497]EHO40394.1 hypothetical protein Calab_0755 [Caldithrix abyssi DSM 13497]EHO41124.1 hypothetical protein Calab_1504 [Caldithrix abyssi DSM 13497]